MKAVKNNKYLSVGRTGVDGGCGFIRLPRNNKTGFVKASIIWSWGGGWEHVSICPLNGRLPNWNDMCLVKDLFFEPEDWVVQYHPARSEYVNMMPNCLHLWKPIREQLPTPPSWMTGIKGISFTDIGKTGSVDCGWK